jgi:uncharacterized membrane protein (DUF2068 family)
MTEEEQTPITVGPHPVAARRTLRAIALFEAVKGLAALIAIVGLTDLMHRDVRHLAEELIGRFRMRPDGHYSSVILHYADLVPGMNMHGLALMAAGYITIRFLEAYGLWNDKAWAEWLAALSGAIYVPFELEHFLHRPTLINGGVLLGNLIVVVFLGLQLWRRRKLALAAHHHSSV